MKQVLQNQSFNLKKWLKARNYIVVLISLFATISMTSQSLPICTDFNSGTNEGWNPLASNISISNPNTLDGTDYLRIRDASGASWTYNTSTYPTNLINLEGNCLCFDYKVFNDGVSGTAVNLNPIITIFQGANPNSGGVRATFRATSITITENSDWVHVCAPITGCSGATLPSNAQGSWTMASGLDCTDWNNLLSNVSGFAFWIDVSGSSAQTEIVGVDNICIQECDIDVGQEGETDYCCDSDINEIKNGNFEGGNSGFTSSYSVGSNSLYGTVPGQYYVGTNADGLAISSLWNVNDHSACTIGSINDEVLFINGKTTQPPTTESVVYQQNIMLGSANEEGRYKFCANFKNMPQATFDIIPQIDIRVNGISQTGGYVTLNNTIVTDPCSWELVGFDFIAVGSVNIEVFLKEDGFGDGNDFAMDDISIQKLQDPNYSITVQHQGDPQVITGSINSIAVADDSLECESKDYCWYVVEVTNYGGGSISYDINTFASGNSTGSSSYIPSYMPCGTPWNLTTTYPCYPFAQDTLYMIGLYTPPNPECCLDEGWSYQLTFNHNRSSGVLSEDQKDEIRSMLKCGGNATGDDNNDSTHGKTDNSLVVYPNPASDILNIISDKKVKTYQVFNYLGKAIQTKSVYNEKLETINISNLDNGVYILSVVNTDGTIKKTKFIKR